MNSFTRTALVLGLVGVCVVTVAVWRAKSPAVPAVNSSRTAYYQDSMHPWIKSDKPGKCTLCGMDLTPVQEGQQTFALSPDTVVLAPNSVTVLNVQTEVVKAQPLTRTLKVAGTLEANEARRNIVSAPAIGRVDNLFIEYVGVEVEEGQPLMTFYSPTWANQSRRFSFLNRVATSKGTALNGTSETETAPSLQGQTVHQGLGAEPAQPDGKSRIGSNFFTDLLAPQSGTIMERLVSKGQYVQEGEKMFTIIDSSVLWFRFDVYEQQLPWLETGQQVEVSTPSVPGKSFAATIAFIEPAIHDATRTIRVRADILNPMIEQNGQRRRLLRYGMYADGVVQASAPMVLTIPRDAVLLPGGEAYAYRDTGHGVYERRRLKLGRQGDNAWEVIEGLSAGDRVVTSGNVLIDAQSQLNRSGSPEQFSSNALPAPAHLKPVHTMSTTLPATAGMASSTKMDPMCGVLAMSNQTSAMQTSVALKKPAGEAPSKLGTRKPEPSIEHGTLTAAAPASDALKPNPSTPLRSKAGTDRVAQAFAKRLQQTRENETNMVATSPSVTTKPAAAPERQP